MSKSSELNVKVKIGVKSFITVIAILVAVLICVGIRMALSTVADEKAKYKKMFMAWVESIIILFVMVYIMVAVAEFGDIITGIFYDIRCDVIASDPEFYGDGVFENKIRETTYGPLFLFSGLTLTFWSVIYWCLLFLEIKFFWLYLKRLLMKVEKSKIPN